MQRPMRSLKNLTLVSGSMDALSDSSLGWLEPFAHVRDLTIDLWHATSFDLLSGLTNLERLSLGDSSWAS
jgi:hypothetical protein